MWIVLSIIFLLLTITLVLSFPTVQTKVAQYAVGWLNDTYQTEIQLERMRYIFPDEVVLKEVYLPDHKGDTMVYASSIDLHLHGFNSVTNTAYSSGLKVEDLMFNWVTHPGDTVFNFLMFVEKFKSKDTTQSKPFSLEISEIELVNGSYRYEELACDSCFRFWLKDLNFNVNDFDLEGQFLSLEVEELSGNDLYSVSLRDFQTYFEYQKDHILLDDLKFTTGKSHFDGRLSLNYQEMPDFRDFVNKVTMVGEIKNSNLNSREIQYWGPQFPDFGQFKISGGVNGIVNDMQITDVILDVAESTHFEGDLELRNATTPSDLFLKAEQVDLYTTPTDARFVNNLFTDTTLPKEIEPLGNIKLTGSFDGYLNNFNTAATITTDLGRAKADLYLYLPEGQKLPQYKGDISLNRFKLGEMLGDTAMGLISTQLAVDGEGFDPTVMNTRLKGGVSLFQYRNYNYSNINVNGRVEGGNFDGRLKVNDPNLKFNFDGKASFQKDTSSYNFTANVEMADLHALNFVKDSMSLVTAEMDINLKALNYDRWEGDVMIYNTTYENQRNFHFFQDITIHSEGLDTSRYLELRSNIIDANLRGSYSLEGVVQAFGSQITRFIRTRNTIKAPENEQFTFEIEVKNTQILTDIFMEELSIEPNSELKGSYSSDSNTFHLDLRSPGFAYKKTDVNTIELNFSGSPSRSQLSFEVGRLELPTGFVIDSINLGNFYYNDTLFYDLRWVLRDSIDSRTNLVGYAIQEDTSTFRFGISESDFNIGFQKFNIPKGNSIVLDSGGVHIENLIVQNDERAIYVNGNISDNPHEILRLNMRGFGMNLVNYLIGSPEARFSGELYGDVLLTELLGQPKFAADVRIDSLEMNKTYLGDFSLNSYWAVQNDTINIEAKLQTGKLTTFSGNGYYQPDSLGAINFDLDFNRFKLAAFDPFLSGLAKNLRGYAEGAVSVSGNTGKPMIEGELDLPQTAFTVSLLNTDYNLVGTPKVTITPDAIKFPNLKARDTKYGTEANIGGEITHKNFSKFRFDLDIEADELLVLNTTAETDDPYYGTAFVSGNIGVNGPLDEILVTADVVSARNTEFFLPIDGATEVDKSGFVTFVDHSKKDTLQEIQQRLQNPNKGVTIDFNIEIDQNADVVIIIDSDVGNQLEAKGTGNIRLVMKPYSDLEMYGTYTVIEGQYDFVLPVLSQNLLAREFDVLRGGSLTWNGNPLEALISLTARYTTKADPGSLLAGSQVGGGPTLTILDLYLSGELMDPQIDFDISAPRAPSSVQTALNNTIANQDALYTQVFSILALNRFAPDQGLQLQQASRSLGFSALANQAAAYINMLTGDYRVSIDYQGANTETDIVTSEQLEVGVSKRFLDNRFTVSTQVGYAIQKQSPDQNLITGDFEIEYNITEDGRFRAKAFNRSVQDNYIFGQQNYQQGVGVFYRVDFEHIFGDNQKQNDEATRKEEDEGDLIRDQEQKEIDDKSQPESQSKDDNASQAVEDD